jgi:hypothetical protein
MDFYNVIRRKQKNLFNEDGINNTAPICTPMRPIRSKRDSREFKSGLIISPDIMLIPATTEEKELLAEAGLNINDNPTDKTYVIKSKMGKIKGAISFSTNEEGNTSSVNYIDVDKEGDNFKKGLVRLATSPNGISLQKQQIEVTRDEIREDLIVN